MASSFSASKSPTTKRHQHKSLPKQPHKRRDSGYASSSGTISSFGDPAPTAVCPNTTLHRYQLPIDSSAPWCRMDLKSGAQSGTSLPTYYEDKPIEGQVVVDLEKAQAYKSVSIQIKGRLVTSIHTFDDCIFLDLKRELWNKSEAPSKKLLGMHVWPFSVFVPRTVVWPGTERQRVNPLLPSTFAEKHTAMSIQYEVYVVFQGEMFKADKRCGTQFVYTPLTKPEPPSMLRQLAYREEVATHGPAVDPQGWKTYFPVRVRGTMFQTRKVDMKLQMSFASPLNYTRGTSIPLHLQLESQDWQALDKLSANNAIRIELRRQVECHYKRDTGPGLLVNDNALLYNNPRKTSTTLASAKWWPSSEGYSSRECRCLFGEIALPANLQPTYLSEHYNITYSVCVLPFATSDYISHHPSSLIMQVPAEISTQFADGPHHVPLSRILSL